MAQEKGTTLDEVENIREHTATFHTVLSNNRESRECRKSRSYLRKQRTTSQGAEKEVAQQAGRTLKFFDVLFT